MKSLLRIQILMAPIDLKNSKRFFLANVSSKKRENESTLLI